MCRLTSRTSDCNVPTAGWGAAQRLTDTLQPEGARRACFVTQLRPTPCSPVDCSLPGSSVHAIPQERLLEWAAFPSLGDLPDPGIKPASPALAGRFFAAEPPGKPKQDRGRPGVSWGDGKRRKRKDLRARGWRRPWGVGGGVRDSADPQTVMD